MKQTLNKLKSNSGATIIIALMFMLICVFVGGSVLVAATVNGGRLAGERADQQAILNQRSIAAVIADELSENGVIDLSFAIMEDAGQKTVYAPGLSGVRLAIFNSTKEAYKPENSQGTAKFTVSFKDTDNKQVELACTVTTTIEGSFIENRITFDDNPKVMIVLNAIEGSSDVSWYSLKVEKGGAAK